MPGNSCRIWKSRMIDASPEELITVKKILTQHVPGLEVRVFGSRVNGSAKPYSDLDLAIVAKDKIPQEVFIELKESFQESSLPFRIDVLDWHRISPEFKKIITQKYILI